MAADETGFSDPYVTLKLHGHKTWHSSVRQKTINPSWAEETMRVRSKLGDVIGHSLHVKVFDKDFMGMIDDRLGSARVPLDGLLASNEVAVEDVKLQDAPSGAVSLIVRFVPDDEPAAVAVAAPAEAVSAEAAAPATEAAAPAADAHGNAAPSAAAGGPSAEAPAVDAPVLDAVKPGLQRADKTFGKPAFKAVLPEGAGTR